jgi:tetratricopeptide (TPR) repeat protein
VTLRSGEYMKVSVEQQGRTLLKVEALDPAGKIIAQINLAGASLWAFTETSGDYQIIIAAPTIKGIYGPYSIQLEEVAGLQTASLTDQVNIKAHGLVFQGDQLVASNDPQSLRRAVDCFQEALPLWRQLGERPEEAYTLHELGFSYSALREMPKALEIYAQAISLWETTENHKVDAAETLYNMGSLYSSSGETDKAITCFQKSIKLKRSVGDKGSLVYSLTNLGQIFINIGEFQQALECFTLIRQQKSPADSIVLVWPAASWPQAARISRPLGRRTKASTAFDRKISWNASTRSAGEGL